MTTAAKAKMDPAMTKKIEAVLERVKEPETLRSVADLSLVTRVQYSKNYGKLVVYTTICSPRTSCMVCGLVTSTIEQTIQRELKTEFGKEFPDLTIDVRPS